MLDLSCIKEFYYGMGVNELLIGTRPKNLEKIV